MTATCATAGRPHRKCNFNLEWMLRFRDRHMANREQCSKPLTAKSRSRAEEAERDGTLILLESILRCECGARVGARCSATGVLTPTRHFPLNAPPPVHRTGKTKRSHPQRVPQSRNDSDIEGGLAKGYPSLK